MQKQVDPLDSAFRDIVEGERRLGEVLATLVRRDQSVRALTSEVGALKKELLAVQRKLPTDLDKRIRALAAEHALRLTELYAMAGKPALLGAAARARRIAEGEALALARLLLGLGVGDYRKVTLRAPLAIDEATPLRATLSIDRSDGAAATLHLRETAEQGVHSAIIRCAAVTTLDLHRVSLDLRPEGTPCVRIRLRSAADHRNKADCLVDLTAAKAEPVLHGVKTAQAWASVRALAGGWLGVEIATPLRPDGAQVELEVISLPQSAGSSRHAGDPARGFAMRRSSLWRVALETKATASAPEPQPAVRSAAAPSEDASDASRRLRDQRRRAELRASYLASGAYRRVAAMRNQHADRRAFIIGNGPSLKQHDLRKLRGEITFVTNWFVNHPDYDQISPSYYCVSSHEMFGGWRQPKPELNSDWLNLLREKECNETRFFFSFKFRKYIQDNSFFSKNPVDYLLFDKPKETIDEANDVNLDLSRSMLDGYTGIMTFCLPLAYHFGISEVYLLGCDCDYSIKSDSDEKAYFYDYSQHKTSTTKTESLERVWADGGPVFQAYEIVRDRFAAEGIPIVNCTPGGRLNVFPRASFDDVLSLGKTEVVA